MSDKDYLEYIKDESARYGVDYKQVIENYKAMLKANFEQDIHDVINNMEDKYL